MQVKDVTKLRQEVFARPIRLGFCRIYFFCVNLFRTKPLFFHRAIHKRLDDAEYGENKFKYKFEFSKKW
jgi:hypothetical protein